MQGAASSSRPALRALVPYEPGKPVEELQRELGLERVVKLASNEGTSGPFPAALDAIERCARELNRYPDGGAYRLRTALADRHGVRFEEVAPGSGADGVVDCLSQALLDPGDEIVYALEGSMEYQLDGKAPVTIKAGEVLFIPAGTIHAVKNVGSACERRVSSRRSK